jgi:hypothetical protein
MKRSLSLVVIAAALVAAHPARSLSAQQLIVPEALDPSSPRVLRARAVVDLVLAGDRPALEAYLKEHGTDALLADTLLAGRLTTLIETARTGARSIARVDGVPEGAVAVALAPSADGAPERALIVGLEPGAPYRISRLRIVRMSIGGG